MKDIPKVLIIGQPFNKLSGGGITISSLFKLWPKDKLFLATNTHRALKNDFSICPNVYLLGRQETKTPFLFRFLLKHKESGQVSWKNDSFNELLKINPSIISKSNFLYRFLSKILKAFDLNYLLFRIKVSKKFESWIHEIKPDIIYSQLGHLEFNYFVLDLKKVYNKPLVIHVMDDWPECSAVGLFKKYWQKKLRESFHEILDISDELITISAAMQKEYQRRYKKGRFYFHNPIRTKQNLQPDISRLISANEFRIGYFGRIGASNSKSIAKTIQAVRQLNAVGKSILFDIYTPDIYAVKVKNSKFIRIREPVSHGEILKYMQNYALLLLPLDFDKDSVKYAKFSFPTKASEYMISGKLILAFGPDGAAIIDHAKCNHWAVVVDENNIEKLKAAILSSRKNYQQYNSIIKNALRIAKAEFDEIIVCSNFLNLFQELTFNVKTNQLDNNKQSKLTADHATK